MNLKFEVKMNTNQDYDLDYLKRIKRNATLKNIQSKNKKK